MQKQNWNQSFIVSWKINIKVPSKLIHKPKIKGKKWSPKIKEERSSKSSKINKKFQKEVFSLLSNPSIYTNHNTISN
jgi:hypothetical protein